MSPLDRDSAVWWDMDAECTFRSNRTNETEETNQTVRERGNAMLIEYIEEALKRARYEMIEDEEPYYGEVEDLKGVWATGKTLEECRENLKEVIEGWIIVSIKRRLSIPKLGDREITEIEEASAIG